MHLIIAKSWNIFIIMAKIIQFFWRQIQSIPKNKNWKILRNKAISNSFIFFRWISCWSDFNNDFWTKQFFYKSKWSDKNKQIWHLHKFFINDNFIVLCKNICFYLCPDIVKYIHHSLQSRRRNSILPADTILFLHYIFTFAFVCSDIFGIGYS